MTGNGGSPWVKTGSKYRAWQRPPRYRSQVVRVHPRILRVGERHLHREVALHVSFAWLPDVGKRGRQVELSDLCAVYVRPCSALPTDEPSGLVGIGDTETEILGNVRQQQDNAKFSVPDNPIHNARSHYILNNEFRAWRIMNERLRRGGFRIRRLGILSLAVAATVALASCSSSPSNNTSTTSSSPPTSSTTTSSTTPRLTSCIASGCAVVNTVRVLPRTTTYYGASCSGPVGEWFLNVVVAGPKNSPRVSYRLQWTFSSSTTVAKPIGAVFVNGVNGRQFRITVANGVYMIAGNTASGMSVSGRGSLTVSLTGTSAAPTLTFTERGLSSTESALGLVSPFATVSGQPYSVPVTSAKSFPQC